MVRSTRVQRPLEFATPNMPEDFQKIPLEHRARACSRRCRGRSRPQKACCSPRVPRTGRVSKKTLKPLEVAYQGEPKFQPIEKTQVQSAVNTDKEVFKVGDAYYMCYQGVWFKGLTPTGVLPATY